jgi:hypothetical protein
MTLSNNIDTISTALDDIHDAIVAKGVTPSGNITTYATAIGQISGGGSATINPLSVTPSTTAQTITASGGVDGYSPISVSAVTSAIDSNIVAGNIKDGVTILGVTGTYSGGGGGGQKGAIYAGNQYGIVCINKDFFFDLTGVTCSSDLNFGTSITGTIGQPSTPVQISMPSGMFNNGTLYFTGIALDGANNRIYMELIGGNLSLAIADITYNWDWGTSTGTLTYTLARPLNNWSISG